MNRTSICILATIFILQGNSIGQLRVRQEVKFPDILGYKTLACDFHTHTVFSDGYVWPTVRSEEAWRNGLDAIAITDHIEYQPHREDIPTNFNRSFQLANQQGQDLGLIVIKGSEIIRKMPPGHFNAIFLEDATKLDTVDWRDALQAAYDQGAFIFWNHPGWRGQQPDGMPRWYNEHTELLEKGLLHGIEVVNEHEYYPQVHQWCLEKNLTMLSNSDIHQPIYMEYDYRGGNHSAMTLVFAREKTLEAIKEALMDQRTVAYTENTLIGQEKFLRPLFTESIEIENSTIRYKDKKQIFIRIKNQSQTDFKLTLREPVHGFDIPDEFILYAEKTNLMPVKKTTETEKKVMELHPPYIVNNLLIRPDIGLPVEITLKIEN